MRLYRKRKYRIRYFQCDEIFVKLKIKVSMFVAHLVILSVFIFGYTFGSLYHFCGVLALKIKWAIITFGNRYLLKKNVLF